MFADLSELSRNKPGGELEAEPDSPVHSPREYFHSYLQSLDVERAGLPEAFQAKLKQVLGHYGVTDLDRTPELEAAVFRIFLAQQRMSTDVAVVSELLRQWLAGPPPLESLSERAGLTLEHLVEATQVRFPAVSDLARGVVFRWFAQPLLRRNRAKVYAAVREDLRHLDRNPDAPDRAERIQAMVASAEPLVRLIGQRIGRPGRDHAPLLEVLTRRYYGNRALSEVTVREVAGCRFVTAEHTGSSGVTRIVTTAVDIAALPAAIGAVGTFAAGVAERALVADLYVTWEDQPDADAMAVRLGELLAGAAARRGPPDHHHGRRHQRRGDAPPLHLPPATAPGFAEDRLIRGLHPQIAQRLQLHRLREFDLTRLPSADEEIYLFKAVARATRPTSGSSRWARSAT